MVSPADVRAALARVLASDAFVHAGRVSRFLRFTVEQTLDGGAEGLKEYSLGLAVFDRDDSFDPRIDSIVRVEARRLRTKLSEYYAAEGATDPVVIQLHKGSYVPQFGLRQQPAEASTPGPMAASLPAPTLPPSPAQRRTRRSWLGAVAAACLAAMVAAVFWLGVRSHGATPTAVAVLPFEAYSADPADQALAARVTDGVIAQLARVPALDVRSRTSVVSYRGSGRSVRDIARELRVDFVVEARVEARGGQLEVEARLVNAATDRKFWVEEFSGPATDPDVVERRVAGAVAAALAAPRPANARR